MEEPGQTTPTGEGAGQPAAAPPSGAPSDAGLKAVLDLLNALGRSDFAAVQQMTGGVRFSADSLRATIKRFGKTPAEPPGNIASHFNIRPVPMTQEPTWSIGVPMWTKEEGRSEIEIRIRVVEGGGGVKVMLDAVRVP
jgi:hypothetical protein